MVFNTTFNNISAISWWSVLLVEETGGPRENHWPVANHWQTLSHIMIMLYTSPWSRFELTTSVVIGTNYIASCKSNYGYHTITATTGLIGNLDNFLWSRRVILSVSNGLTLILAEYYRSVWRQTFMTLPIITIKC